MNKKEALAVMESNIISGRLDILKMTSKEDVECQLRMVSLHEAGLRNAIFELGMHELVKAFKRKGKKIKV